MLCPEEVCIVESKTELGNKNNSGDSFKMQKWWKLQLFLRNVKNTENKVSSADTIKPYDSVIYSHWNRLFKIEKQLVLFSDIHLWKKYLLVVVDVGGTALCITNSVLAPLLVTRILVDLAEKERTFLSHHWCFQQKYQNSRDSFVLEYSWKISREQWKHGENMKKIYNQSIKLDMFDFVRNYSIYKLLQNYNEYLLTVNCSISVLHNTVKYNRDNSSFNLEGCVTKVFNHFSSPAKTVSELQEIFHFVSIECQEIMRHAPTRWLYFAVEKILKYISRIRSYICSLKGTCPETVLAME